MKRRTFFMCLAGTAAAGLTGLSLNSGRGVLAGKGKQFKLVRQTRALGAAVRLTVYHENKTLAGKAIDAAFQEISRVEDIMSLYRPDSQICELNRNGQLKDAQPALLKVLSLAHEVSEKTAGAFDITIQPLWSVYYQASLQGRAPAESAVKSALAKVDWRRVRTDGRRVDLDGKGTAITLNGIAQGYAADAVARVLAAHGVTSALIDTGEISPLGQHIDREEWSVGIKHPRLPGNLLALASLNRRCLATSGDYETTFSSDFSSHHLIDPKTGHSPMELASVSVAAPTAMAADAYSTAIFMSGLNSGRTLAESIPGIDALFVTKSGQIEQTSGFPSSGLA